MDDTCAVCADTLEWVAYGPCGHKEVCSTCVARLRFICNDRRCCICKAESNVVFVTKALGDYTRMINDFSLLPSAPRDGQVGSYWYHEDTEAVFDDMEQYKMVKAMCLLSCSVCSVTDEQLNDGSKKRAKFRNIEQLKGHLFHQHKLLMCSLCLEGRKVFICEQKLYTRAQLNQHISTGDCEVDGSESDRGGFAGHPMCEFCRNPFYGDNELYSHMSTEHYTCHICQRQNPGQYEYYKNYDDLEIHFRGEHFLCEDDACLAKKFVVFQSESEIKRHNAMEHGGRMSRAQRSAALSIPTSFHFKRRNEDHRRGRHAFRSETSDNQLSMAIQASLAMANSASSFQDPSSSSAQFVSDSRDVDGVDPIVQPFNALSTIDSEPSSRYLEATSTARNAHLEESSFPPLPMAPSSSRQNHSGRLAKNTMAERLRRQGAVTVINSGRASPSLRLGNPKTKKKKSHVPSPSSSSTQSIPMTNNVLASSNGSVQITSTTPSWPAISQSLVSTTGSTSSSRNSSGNSNSSNSDCPPVSSTKIHKPSSSSKPLLIGKNGHTDKSFVSSSSDFPPVSAPPINMHSSSSKPSLNAKNVRTHKFFISSKSDFPPVSATHIHKPSASSKPPLNVKDVHTENKSLVESIRAALEFDEDKYNDFKEISEQYRLGTINTVEYLASVQQFGLTHLVLDLARLCPNAQKQKELIETYNTNMRSIDSLQNGWENGNLHLKKESSSSKNGKGKQHLDAEPINMKSSLADNVMASVRELQSSYRPSEGEVEKLSKDGYRMSKGKSIVIVEPQEADINNENQTKTKLTGKSETAFVPNQSAGGAGGGSKQRKKTSKFHRIRLGDGSAELNLNGGNHDSEVMEDSSSGKGNSEGPPVRGVWQNGASKNLFKNMKI